MNGPTYSYPIPTRKFIPADPTTRRLYKLEELVHEAINRAAHELARLLSLGTHQYWTEALPRELYTILDGYDRHASVAAAVMFLRQEGYQVTPEPEIREK